MTISEFARAIIRQGLEAIGKYYSVYRGYVIDNNDPDGMGRIQVRLPEISRDKPLIKWAYPKSVFSGNNYGMQLLPMIGDLVWVEFQQGNTRFPVWSHGHFVKDEKPTEFVTPQVYGFKTPKGQLIIIDDRDDIEKIIINNGENGGLVKVIELTERLNTIEDKLNNHLSHYRTHIHIDPISGYTGVTMPVNGQPDMATPIPSNVDNTDREYIENEKVLH